MTWKPKAKDILGKQIKYFFVNLIEKNGFSGLFDPQDFTIHIDKSLNGDELKQTILHEEFHAAWHRAGINQTFVSKDLQEIIVETLSTFVIEHYHLKPK